MLYQNIRILSISNKVKNKTAFKILSILYFNKVMNKTCFQNIKYSIF